MDADDRIASLTYRTSRRLVWTTTRSPAGLESTRYPTPYTPESAFDIEAAAEHLDLADAGRLQLHLADPAPAGRLLTLWNYQGLVASPDPEFVHHVEGIESISDDRQHTTLPTRAVLDAILDNWECDPLDPSYARDLWQRYREAARHPMNRPGIGPLTGWLIEPGTPVRVSPLTVHRVPEDVSPAAARAVVEHVDWTDDSWFDAVDAMRSPTGRRHPALDSAAHHDLDNTAREWMADLLVDLLFWRTNRTYDPGVSDDRVEAIGSAVPCEGSAGWSVRITHDAAPMVFAGPLGSDGLPIRFSGGQIMLTATEIDSLCARLGAPPNTHPIPVLSLFADEIGKQGPVRWLLANGVTLRGEYERP